MHLRIGPHPYTVISDQAHDAVLDLSDEYGCCVFDELSILVHSQLPLSAQRDTLLHEVLHAVLHRSAFTAAENPNDEVVVMALATPLLDVLQRNPHLVEFLTS